jgi:hypothetical protein
VKTLRYGREIRWLFQTALTIFLITIGLGMARGIGLITFEDRNQLLTHLHSGAIGWITLGILATVLWLYGGEAPRDGDERWVSWTTLLLMVAVPVYIVAWWTGNLPFRAIAGSGVLIGILSFAVWLLREAASIGYRNLTTPQLGAVVGLSALVIGSTLGVLLQISYASATVLLPGQAVGAHAETQVSAYLVLVAMSVAYWRLRGNDRTRRGTWMVWLFFLGGAINAVSLLANAVQGASAFEQSKSPPLAVPLARSSARAFSLFSSAVSRSLRRRTSPVSSLRNWWSGEPTRVGSSRRASCEASPSK